MKMERQQGILELKLGRGLQGGVEESPAEFKGPW